MRALNIRNQINYGTKTITTIPVKLNLIDESYFDNTILSTANSVVEYDILVWNDNDILLFEKKGKTSREKLKEVLTFNAEIDTITYIHLDLTIIINGKRIPFLTLSPNNRLFDSIAEIIQIDKIMYDPSFIINGDKRIGDLNPVPSVKTPVVADEKSKKIATVVYSESGEILASDFDANMLAEFKKQIKELRLKTDISVNICLPMITQEDINNYISDNIGKIPMDLPTEMDTIYNYGLLAKVNAKKAELEKKQTLSSIFKTAAETEILDNMANETLYINLMNLLKSYEDNGLENLSEYRLRVHENLKLAVDNLIKLKGRLENI